MSRFSIFYRFFCVTVPKCFAGEPFSVSLIAGIKKFRIRGGREYRDFPSKFLSRCTDFFIGEHFGLSEKFFYRNFPRIGGGASWFCRIFLSHRTKTKSLVKEPFGFSEFFWYREKFMEKTGHITIFYRKFVVSQYPKNFVEESFCVPEKFRYRKMLGTREGANTTLSRRFCLSQSAKTFVGEPLVFL